jgi:hypothetical protein
VLKSEENPEFFRTSKARKEATILEETRTNSRCALGKKLTLSLPVALPKLTLRHVANLKVSCATVPSIGLQRLGLPILVTKALAVSLRCLRARVHVAHHFLEVLHSSRYRGGHVPAAPDLGQQPAHQTLSILVGHSGNCSDTNASIFRSSAVTKARSRSPPYPCDEFRRAGRHGQWPPREVTEASRCSDSGRVQPGESYLPADEKGAKVLQGQNYQGSGLVAFGTSARQTFAPVAIRIDAVSSTGNGKQDV